MKISVITCVLNNSENIKDAIKSFQNQTYKNKEHIIIDGGSTDDTLNIIENYKDRDLSLFSSKDEGIYHAINKGINLSSGYIIGILHSDDFYNNNNVITDVANMYDTMDVDLVYGDLEYVSKKSPHKKIRNWNAGEFKETNLKKGWMPPHPTCFIKRSLFDEFGLYSLNYKIASDFDFLVRIFYGREIKWSYVNQVTVKMKQGGISNSGWQSKKLIMNEIKRSLRSNGIWSLYIFQLIRYLIRLIEVLIKPKKGECD